MKARYLLLPVALLLATCTNNQENAQQQKAPDSLATTTDSLVAATDTLSLADYSKAVLQLLKKKQYQQLQRYIHPTKGIRFSPYGYINTESDVHIKGSQLSSLIGNTEKTLWGSYDGSGDDIRLTFREYAGKFIYDADFLNAEKYSINKSLASGNTLNNLTEVYPNAEYTESYFSGFEEKYQGMDWKALRLVYEKYEGQYYLVGVVHDQWTI